METPQVHTPEEAERLSVGDFSEAAGCRFLIVAFPETYDGSFALHLRKRFLGELLSLDPEKVGWRKNENGKPFIEGSPVHFSVSHSGSYWAFASSLTGPVGIDIEVWRDRDRLSRIARRVFLEEENLSWSALPTKEEQIRRILTLWTRKEAYIKAKGSVLFRELSKFDARDGSDATELWTCAETGKFVLSLARLK